MGGYTAGQNDEIDKAMACWTKICSLIKQGETEKTNYQDSLKKLFTVN